MKADAEHLKWLQHCGLDPSTLRKKLRASGNGIEFPVYVYTKVQYSNVVGSGTKRGVMSNLHKEETKTQKEILIKASRVMPLYNKGALQYCTDGTDLTTVGTKSRKG